MARLHDSQRRMAIDTLQREVDQMGIRINANRMRMGMDNVPSNRFERSRICAQ